MNYPKQNFNMKDLTNPLKKLLDTLLFRGLVNFEIQSDYEFDEIYFYKFIIDLDVDKYILISPEHDDTYMNILDEYDFHDRLDDVLRYIDSDIEFTIIFNHINYEKTNEELKKIQSKVKKIVPTFKMSMEFDERRIPPILEVEGVKGEKTKEQVYHILTDDAPDGFNLIDMVINLKN